MNSRPRLLVIGAQMDSLGREVYEAGREFFDATTAGQTEVETHYPFDIRDPVDCSALVMRVQPEHIVCTAGVNYETRLWQGGSGAELMHHYGVNAVGPLNLLRAWRAMLGVHGSGMVEGPKHFVAISSNSAHIARTNSAGYCMSKAALSMGIRCAARELAGTEMVVYGYEPGWLVGTPMSVSVQNRLVLQSLGEDELPQMHRIPGGDGVDPVSLAQTIVRAIRFGGREFNGTMLRIDGGEQ